MKRMILVFLALLLLLGGLFLWKGGHHAVALYGLVEEWLDADAGEQAATLQLTIPGFRPNSTGEQFEPHIRHLYLSADTFWTEYADRTILGLSAQGVTAYIDGNDLYMDTGASYRLPDMSGQAERLLLGLLIHGRVTKTGDTYRVRMDTEELELDVSVTADRTVRAISVMAVLPNDAAVRIALTSRDPVRRTIPAAVTEAMVRARIEPPIPIMEPLEVLLPAFEGLLPLEGALKLDISCGILELSETVELVLGDEQAVITRGGTMLELALPGDLGELSPAAWALLLLRDGQFTREQDTAQFALSLSEEDTTALLEALVPQAAGLGIVLSQSRLSLRILGGRITQAALTANGTVPFLFTTIPVTFSAGLTVS